MSYYLVAPSGHSAELPPRPICVGSDPQADIPIIANVGLAPRHFVLVPQDRGHRIQSLDLEAKVKINGHPVHSHELKEGDLIEAGMLALRYQADNKWRDSVAPEIPPELAAPAVPEVVTPPLAFPLEPVPEPEPEAKVGGEEPIPRRGYRRPEAPRPLDMEDETVPVKTVGANPQLDRMMAATDRARAYVEEQKANQSMVGAIFAGSVAALGVSVAWNMVSFLPWIFFFAVVSGLGYVVGSAVRAAGRGFELKFGYTAAVLALMGGLLANFGRYAVSEQMAEPAPTKMEIRGADDATNEDFQASLKDLGIDPESPEFRGHQEEESGGNGLLLMILLFSPRSLIAYVVIMGAAYKAAFRTLTAEEAARMHFG